MQQNYVEYVANQMRHYENSAVKYDTNVSCDSFFKHDIIAALVSLEGNKNTLVITLDDRNAKKWKEYIKDAVVVHSPVDIALDGNVYIIPLNIYNNIYKVIDAAKNTQRILYDNCNLNYKGMLQSDVKWFFLFCECGGVIFHGTKA